LKLQKLLKVLFSEKKKGYKVHIEFVSGVMAFITLQCRASTIIDVYISFRNLKSFSTKLKTHTGILLR